MELKGVGGPVERLAVSIGYVEVLPQQVSILAETAEKKDEIDVPRAEASKKRAEDRLKAGRDTDLDRAAISLARAMARIQTARK